MSSFLAQGPPREPAAVRLDADRDADTAGLARIAGEVPGRARSAGAGRIAHLPVTGRR